MSGLKAKTIVLHLSDKSLSISLETSLSFFYPASSLSRAYSLSKRASRSMENQLVVIIEGLIDFEEMMAHGLDFKALSPEMVGIISLICSMVLLTLTWSRNYGWIPSSMN